MKTLKGNGTSFGILDFTINGRPRTSANDNYTDANAMIKTGIWKVSAASDSSMHVDHLPVSSGGGFLIVLDYETGGAVQIFIHFMSKPAIYTRTFRSSAWGSWYQTDQTEVTA